MIHVGNCIDVLKGLDSNSVDCIVTSPPYWGLRAYGGNDGMIGMEPTFDEYLEHLRLVFGECQRILKPTGTLWLNMGDSYAGSWGNYSGQNRGAGSQRDISTGSKVPNRAWDGLEQTRPPASRPMEGIKPKNLIGQPWRLAFALQADGWYLRSDIIWHKLNPMPESVKDRPTRSHEYIFLLTKSAHYYYDADAVREPLSESTLKRDLSPRGRSQDGGGSAKSLGGYSYTADLGNMESNPSGANARTVWTIATQAYKEAHFATYPEELPKRCILAGCPVGGIVLDPFAGSGTTLAVAVSLGREAIGIEINPEYADLIRKRLLKTTIGMKLESAEMSLPTTRAKGDEV